MNFLWLYQTILKNRNKSGHYKTESQLKTIDKTKPISLDELSEKIEIAAYKILPDLLQLELSGYIKALSGRQYIAL